MFVKVIAVWDQMQMISWYPPQLGVVPAFRPCCPSWHHVFRIVLLIHCSVHCAIAHVAVALGHPGKAWILQGMPPP